jgi:translation initiation factor 3 subunit C
MLIEVPNMTKGDDGVQHSRSFHRDLERFQRRVLESPPEDVKSCVLVAAQELSKGNWRKCSELVLNLDVWKLWSHCGMDKVKQMLRRTIKEVSLRTYVLSYNSHYESMSVDQLCHMFDLDKSSEEDRRRVRCVVNKLIVSREVHGSWDSKNENVNLHKAEPTDLQHLALEFSRQAEKFVESNERTFESVTGTNTSYSKKKHHKDKKRNRGSNRRGRGRGRGNRWGRRTGFSSYGKKSSGKSGSRSIFMV